MSEIFSYQGTELDFFRAATIWKRYFSRRLGRFIFGNVLEVGAGLGTTAAALQKNSPGYIGWTCLEPDASLLKKISAPATLLQGNLGSLSASQLFDTILYIDVLEHIADDAAELKLAATHLNPGGRLIILAPAHQKLFSEFDRALGHHRRYSRSSLEKLIPPALEIEKSFYLDSAGLLASAANSFLLHRAQPNPAQIWIWDKILVPLSILLDKVTAHRFGKSVVVVAKKREARG